MCVCKSAHFCLWLTNCAILNKWTHFGKGAKSTANVISNSIYLFLLFHLRGADYFFSSTGTLVLWQEGHPFRPAEESTLVMTPKVLFGVHDSAGRNSRNKSRIWRISPNFPRSDGTVKEFLWASTWHSHFPTNSVNRLTQKMCTIIIYSPIGSTSKTRVQQLWRWATISAQQTWAEK